MAMAERAGNIATATTDTDIAIDANNAVFPLKAGSGGTHFNTGRIVAVITEYRQKLSASIRVFAHLTLMHLRKKYIRWRPV